MWANAVFCALAHLVAGLALFENLRPFYWVTQCFGPPSTRRKGCDECQNQLKMRSHLINPQET
jgi:hypothetical protein